MGKQVESERRIEVSKMLQKIAGGHLLYLMPSQQQNVKSKVT
jgi:hypothetical protein